MAKIENRLKKTPQPVSGQTPNQLAYDNLMTLGSGGAFYCEYPVFRDLFQLERRSIQRTGDSIYLCLLTITGIDGNVPKSMILQKAMEHLNTSILNSLRCSDVFTRYSISQYLILLPTVTAEKGEMVLKRIITNFRKLYNRKDITVEMRLQPILPWKNVPLKETLEYGEMTPETDETI